MSNNKKNNINCSMDVAYNTIVRTIDGLPSSPIVGDRVFVESSDQILISDGTTYSSISWATVDPSDVIKEQIEMERKELHEKYPVLKGLWEEYEIMKALCVGNEDNSD